MSTFLQSIRLKVLFNAFLALSLFFAFGVATSFAGDNYTVSGGNPGAFPTVGDASVALPTLTITDTGGDDFLADPETITVAINTTNYNNIAFDSSIAAGALTVAGSCGYTGANALTYSSDRQSVTIPVTGGTNCANAETITIAGLKILTRYGQGAPAGGEALVNVDNTTTTVGAPVNGSNVQLASTVDDAAATVTLEAAANRVVGLAGTTTVGFTLGYIMASTDTIVFTMPAWITVTNGAFTGETDTFSGAGGVDCVGVSATRVITCTANGAFGVVDAAETATIVFASGDVSSNYVATGTNAITDFAINFVADSGGSADIGADTTVTISDTSVGTLTSTSLTPSSTANTVLSAYTIAFTTVGTTMATGAKVVVVFPTGYDLTGISGGTASNLLGLDGTWTASVSSQTLTLTQSSGTTISPGAKSLTIANVRNPAATGSTGTFTLTTTTSASANIQTATPAALTISAGTTSSATLGEVNNVSVADDPDSDGVLITWDDPTSDDTSFIQILKGTDPLPVSGTVYASVALGTEEYVDSDVEVGDVVTYQFRTTDGSDTGTLSAEVTFTVGSGTTTTSDDTTTEDDTTTDDDTTGDDTTGDDATGDDTTDDTTVTEFTDVSGHWAEDEIAVMTTDGIIEGNPDGTFDPDGNLNRASAAALLWRVLMMGDPSEVTMDPFDDVDMGEWYAAYVGGLKDLSLVEGNPDGTYQPSEDMNRAEFLQLAMNVYLYLNADMQASYDTIVAGAVTDNYADLDTSAWYAGVVTAATEWSFVQGSACDEGTCFNAGSTITRAEATKILYNMFAAWLAA